VGIVVDTLFYTKFIAGLLLPPGGLVVTLALGLCLWRWWPRLGMTLVLVGALSLFLLSTSPVVTLLMAGLEDQPLLTREAVAASGAQAVVVLGGGRRDYAPEFGGQTVASATLERIRYGARVHRDTGLPLAVTGGTVSGKGTPEAVLMADALQEDFGVPVRWVEDRSRNTRENAAFTRRMLEPDGVTNIVLVSHAVHLSRASPMFRAEGFDVVPAPTAFIIGGEGEIDLLDWNPGMTNLASSYYALHERLGRLWYRLRTWVAAIS